MSKYFPWNVARKQAEIDIGGREALRREPDKVFLYRGFNAETEKPAMENRFIVAAEFGVQDAKAFVVRVIQPLEKLRRSIILIFY